MRIVSYPRNAGRRNEGWVRETPQAPYRSTSARACTDCDLPLSVYNPDDRCNPCITADRDGW